MNDAIEQFRSAIRSAGLEPPEVIEPGKLHRFASNGKRGDAAGWCKLFADLRGGVFGDHRSGLSEHWSIKPDCAMTAQERQAFRRRVAESKRQAEAEARQRHEAAAEQAAAILEGATGDAATHPYAIKKLVPFGPRVKRGAWPQRGWPDALLIPIYGGDERVWSIEAINAGGDKDFLAGGRIGGGFHPFGKVRGAGRVLIGEGLANVAACVTAEPSPAVAALCASNLKAVALAVRELAPEADIILPADNDVKSEGGNPGLKAAKEAAAAVGGRVAIPELEGRKCDMWDLWAECGAEAVKRAIANAQAPDIPEHQSGGETYDDLLQRANTVDVAGVSGFMAKIAEAGLSRTEQETILRRLMRSTGVTLYALRGDLIGALRNAGVTASQECSATRVIKLAEQAGVELWHDPKLNPWATLPLNDHREHWPLKSKAVRRYIARLYYEAEGTAIQGEAIQTAMTTLEARACFEGEEYETYVRIGEAGDAIYIDLADAQWRVIEITASGWRVVEATAIPLRFRRAGGMRPLPAPVSGGSIADLRAILNLPDERLFRIILCWLVGTLRASLGGYPALAVTGEHDSGKSTLVMMLRTIVDPNECALRTLPRDSRDLFIAASNGWILAFDNVSGIQPWLSDDLCRLATGGGLATRELYTDANETLLSARRPILLNGIEEFVIRQDLVSRSLTVSLPTLTDEARRDERGIYDTLERLHPRVLGVLCDVAADGLARLPSVQLSKLPRMADFARWVAACAPALGQDAEALVGLLNATREELALTALEGDVVAEAIIAFCEATPEITATSGELLERLWPSSIGDPEHPQRNPWPRTPKGLSDRLARLAPALRRQGIEATRLPRHGSQRPWRITKVPIAESAQHHGGTNVTTVTTVTTSRDINALGGDGRGDNGDGRGHRAKQPSPLKPGAAAGFVSGDGGDSPAGISEDRMRDIYPPRTQNGD